MKANSACVLVIDDEVNIRAGLRDVLLKDGHDVKEASSGPEALAILETWPCDVAILDIRMPGMPGDEVLEKIRARWPYTLVVMLTGHGTLETAMSAIKAGAHDYLLKPAQPDVIRATIQQAIAVAVRQKESASLLEALRTGLKRIAGLASPDHEEKESGIETRHLTAGKITIDLGAHEVRVRGELVSLSPMEFSLLTVLASHFNEAVDYMALVREGLGYEVQPWEAKDLIKRHVFALRQKIEADPPNPQYLLNVRGVGYRLTQ
jgi:DNA-binding response OmpR family regulator